MSGDANTKQRLAALGEFSGESDAYPELLCTSPTGVPLEFQSFELSFVFDVEHPDASDYAKLLDEFDRLKQNAEAIARDAELCACELFREVYAKQMSDSELAPYRDDDGVLSERLILAAVQPKLITLAGPEDELSVEFCYDAMWDDEHGLEFELYGDLFARPWRSS